MVKRGTHSLPPSRTSFLLKSLNGLHYETYLCVILLDQR